MSLFPQKKYFGGLAWDRLLRFLVTTISLCIRQAGAQVRGHGSVFQVSPLRGSEGGGTEIFIEGTGLAFYHKVYQL